MDILDELYKKGVSRRNFLVGAGALGAAAALEGCSSNGTIATTTTAANVVTDADILTFALNLEYLEAEFYLYAATGAGLSATDAGSGAGTTLVPSTTKLTGLTAAQQSIVNEIAYDEQQHVKYLRAALTAAGATPAARPALDLTFFPKLAAAAGIPNGASFSPFVPFGTGTAFDSFLLGAFIFEDVGVTAYNGAAPLISPAGITAGYLSAAAGILAVEAYHAAYIRTIITANGNAGYTSPGNTSYAIFGAANLVSALRASLGGGNEVPLTLSAPIANGVATPSSIVAATSANALAYTRTIDQVQHIVYGNATVGTASGGFFPSGTNYPFSKTTT